MKAFVTCLLLLLLLAATACVAQDFTLVRFKSKTTKGGNATQFVHPIDNKEWMEWNVYVNAAGEYSLTLTHFNASSATMDLELNENAVITVQFGATSSDAWGTTTTGPVPLQSGRNAIVLRPADASNGAHVVKMINVQFVGGSDGSQGPHDSGGDDSTTVLYSTGFNDHTSQIQLALDGLSPFDMLHLNGDFVISRTIYFPSDFSWRLDGSLTLGKNAAYLSLLVGVQLL